MLAELATAWTVFQVVLLVAAVAYAATRKPPEPAPLDDALKSTATRGAYIPLLIGRHRVGPVFAWVDDATTGFTDSPGSQPGLGKGSGPGDPQTYRERALHILCVGPASKLLGIYQNGEQLWAGPITPQSHPSGSSFTISGQGTFRVYWGFPDDPILPNLATSDRHGLSVRYALAMKILWVPKDLGPSRNWPRLEYEVECPCYSQIANTSSELAVEADEARPTYRTLGFTQQHNTGNWNIRYTPSPIRLDDKFFMGISKIYLNNEGRLVLRLVAPYFSADHRKNILRHLAGNIIKLTVTDALGISREGRFNASPHNPRPESLTATAAGLPLSAQWHYFWVMSSAVVPSQRLEFNYSTTTYEIVLGPPITGNYTYNVNPAIPTIQNNGGSGVDLVAVGIVAPLDGVNTDGVNPIHMVDQLLFAKKPYGGGRDRSLFDSRSIEEAAAVLEREKIRGSLQVASGEDVMNVLNPIMVDLGLLITHDPTCGKFVFYLVRHGDLETAPDLPAGMVVEAPEMVSAHGPRQIDTLAFTFNDRTRNYRSETVVVMDDGQVSLYDTQRARKIPIAVTSDYDSVTRLVPRRQQEALANQALFRWVLNHEARLAIPGTRFRCSAVEDPNVVFRILSLRPQLDTSKVEVEAVIDAYDPLPAVAETEAFTDSPPPLLGFSSESAAPPLEIFPFETIREIYHRRIGFLFGAARASSKPRSLYVWGSRDGTVFSLIGTQRFSTGGRLLQELPAGGLSYDLGSYPVAPIGVDFDQVEDLTAVEDTWRAGRQVMLIGDEVIFLREAGPDTITGLIRGRCGTPQQTHPEGTPFVVTLAHLAEPVESALFLPGRPAYIKLQAAYAGQFSDIEDSVAFEVQVTGRAQAPAQPSALRLPGFVSGYATTDPSILVLWSWHSTQFPRTGLGTQALGAMSGLSFPQGHFHVRVLDGSTLLLETTTLEPEFEFPAALRSALGLDALPSWTIEVAAVEGSYVSSHSSLTIYPL